MRILSEGYFLGDLWKISLGPPFALFLKMRVLGDLGKVAITLPFLHFSSRCLRLNLLQSLYFKCILVWAKCHLRQSAFGPFKRRLLFGRFLKNFFWSPLCTFSENAGFGWPCLNCHNFSIRAAKIFSSLCTISAYYLQDNAICARVLLGFWREGHFLGDFLTGFLGPPFALFQKMRVLGDVAKLAKNCHNLAIRELLEPLFEPKCFPVLAL